MAEKRKKKDEKKAPIAEATSETAAEEKPTPAPVAPTAPAALPRRGTARRPNPRPAALAVVASATRTNPIVLGALKTAHGWTDRTRLTRREFLRKRDEWLARPASEV